MNRGESAKRTLSLTSHTPFRKGGILTVPRFLFVEAGVRKIKVDVRILFTCNIHLYTYNSAHKLSINGQYCSTMATQNDIPALAFKIAVPELAPSRRHLDFSGFSPTNSRKEKGFHGAKLCEVHILDISSTSVTATDAQWLNSLASWLMFELSYVSR